MCVCVLSIAPHAYIEDGSLLAFEEKRLALPQCYNKYTLPPSPPPLLIILFDFIGFALSSLSHTFSLPQETLHEEKSAREFAEKNMRYIIIKRIGTNIAVLCVLAVALFGVSASVSSFSSSSSNLKQYVKKRR